MEVIIIIITVFQDTCTHGAYLPIEDTRMGCFGERKKTKDFSQVRYGAVHIDTYFLSFVYTEKKKYQQGGGRDIFRVVSMDLFQFLHKVGR